MTRSTHDHHPRRPKAKEARDRTGQPVVINADQLEVSPDGAWLYFLPTCGPMSCLEIRFPDHPLLAPDELGAHVLPFAHTPSAGGTTMDADGVLYLSDVDRSRILTIDLAGRISVLLDDLRLGWVDALWIDGNRDLLMRRPSARPQPSPERA